MRYDLQAKKSREKKHVEFLVNGCIFSPIHSFTHLLTPANERIGIDPNGCALCAFYKLANLSFRLNSNGVNYALTLYPYVSYLPSLHVRINRKIWSMHSIASIDYNLWHTKTFNKTIVFDHFFLSPFFFSSFRASNVTDYSSADSVLDFFLSRRFAFIIENYSISFWLHFCSLTSIGRGTQKYMCVILFANF